LFIPNNYPLELPWAKDVEGVMRLKAINKLIGMRENTATNKPINEIKLKRLHDLACF